MKDFFKSLLASIIGCGIVLGGLLLIFFIVMGAMMGSMMSFERESAYVVKKNSVLYLDLNGTLSDRVEKNPFYELFGAKTANQLALTDILESIEQAKNEDKINGIYIKAGALSASSASLKEIRDALTKFKDSKKFIVAYGDIYTQGCYYLSTVADKVILNPEGMVNLQGYSSSPMFYKGLLDKLGIEMQIFKVGTFKSAVEPYINKEMSNANREQVSSYITDMWKTLSSTIAESRNISIEELNRMTDEFPAFRDTKYVVDNKLVDDLMYESEVHKYLKDQMGVKHDKKIALASPSNLTSVVQKDKVSEEKNLIGVLYAEGTINSGSDREGITDSRYIKELKKLEENDNIKAVVLRINSPGGSAFASEQIWKAIEDVKVKKPVVVSMGDVAASGGYYIACNASKIFAQPNTITGSIGIFGMFPNVGGLTDKVGLSFDNVKTHKLADFGDLSRPMREDEKALVQSYVERGYELFIKRCADGRGLSTDSINAIGQGRVWTGNQALKLGLVDELGGLDDAIEAAAELAGLSKFGKADYPKPVDFMEILFTTKKQDFASELIKDYLGVDYEAFKMMREIKEQDYLQARLPYDLSIQ